MSQPDTRGLKIGPFWIRPGLTRLNVAAVWVASFTTISLTVFFSLITPYVLVEIAQIPSDRQGQVTGYLNVVRELLVICLVAFAGAWSDQVGRRRVFVLGFLLLALGYLVFPLAANELQLYVFMLPFALGVAVAPVMLSTTIQDTPQEVSRGKWLGTNNLLQGLGVVVLATFVLGRGPQWFTGLGYDPVWAGRLSLWSAATLCALAGLFMWIGMPGPGPGAERKENLFRRFGEGVREGLQNPRLAVAFGGAFIGRGDLVVVGSFLTLWITRYGIDAGLSTADATGRAFMIFGIVQIAALSWAFFIGLIADRCNRLTALCIALTLASVGYTAMGQASDPLSSGIIPLAILLGVGEVSVIVTAGSLLGQEAKAQIRGAVVGVFNLMGGVGIIVVSGVGGWIFDHLGRTTPFLMMGGLNALLLLIGLYVRLRAGEPGPENTARDPVHETT